MTKKNVSHDCDDQEKRSYVRTMTHYGLNDCTNLSNVIDIMNSLTSSDPSVTIVMTKKNVSHDCDDQEKRSDVRTMTHYGLNDCTNLSNIIDIMNSLTPPTICNSYSSTSKDIQSLNRCSDINEMR